MSTLADNLSRKAIVMYSGGADSTLALQLMLEQGIECIAVNVKTPFCSCSQGGCAGAIGDIILDNNIKVRTHFIGEDYLRMLINPEYGYGRGINPCSDCRIMMLQAARNIMIEEDASFVVTGEVVGQRPNSQMFRQMAHVERDSGLYGVLLRPLSAKLLPPTLPELKGIVDRTKLLSFSGRSRTPQKQLAKSLKLGELPNSGGGCVLTEPRYAEKVRDLYDHAEKDIPTLDEVELLRVGRHIRFSPEYKVIVGRDESESLAIERLFRPDNLLFIPDENNPGPIALAVGTVPSDHFEKIVSLLLRYCHPLSDMRGRYAIMSVNSDDITIETTAMNPDDVKEYII